MNCRGGGSSIFQAQFCGFDEKKYPCQSTYLADKRFYWQHRKLKDFYLSVMRVTDHSLVAEITDRANVLRWGSQIGKMRPYLDPNTGHYQVLLLIKGEIKMVAPGELPKDSGWKL